VTEEERARGTHVRPWKLSAADRTMALSFSTPLTLYAHLRATLMAVSTASAPVFIMSAISKPVSCARGARKA